MGKRCAAESLSGGGAAGGGDVLPDNAVDLPRRPLRPHLLRADADGERGAAQLRRNRLVRSVYRHALALHGAIHSKSPSHSHSADPLKAIRKFACG